MKIAECVDLYYPYLRGGSERRSFEITKRLSKTDFVDVITSSVVNAPRSELLNDSLRITRIGRFANPADRRSLLSLSSYVLALRRIRPDADIVNYNGFAILGSCRNESSICTIHDLFVDSHDRSIHALLARYAERWFAGRIRNNIVVVPSPIVGEKVTKFLRIDPSRIRIIPNGVDTAHITKFAVKNKEPGKIVFAGRLVAYKNVDHLLKAFSELRKHHNVHLVIIGDGPERLRLERSAPSDVTFAGYLPTDDLYEHISTAQIFVNPSTFEGFSIIMLESMALGTPVIGYRLPAYYYANSSNSLLVEPYDISELKDAMRHLLVNEEKQFQLVQNGKLTAWGYDWEHIIDQLKDVYKEATGN